ncbi:MAG: hypothetical protein U0401_23860 [Anaerolineae bacterium]
MIGETSEAINQAKIAVTFYSGSVDDVWDTLSKKYIVKNWNDEADLRRLLDEIAGEMNYISGVFIQQLN